MYLLTYLFTYLLGKLIRLMYFIRKMLSSDSEECLFVLGVTTVPTYYIERFLFRLTP
jgi:hypothetical protein